MAGDRDPVGVILARYRAADDSMLAARASEQLLRRAEPVARAACRGEARGLPQTEVEELIQDTLEQVWRRLGDYEDLGAFEAWVRTIARNVCSNARRRRRDVLTEDGVLEAATPEHDALRLLRREERERLLTRAIEALEPADQDVLYHRYVHGLDREQVAAVLGLADVNEVRVVLQRASRRLRAEIAAVLSAAGAGPSLFRTSDGG